MLVSRIKILVILSDVRESALRTMAYTYALPGNQDAMVVVGYVPAAKNNDQVKRRMVLNAEIQNRYGQSSNLKLVFRNASGFAKDDLYREAQFADVVVMSEATVKNLHSSSESQWNQSSFSSLGVPLLIIPENAEKPDEILITYNGLPQGIGAIKQFCQLMGDLCRRVKVTLLEMNHQKNHYQPEDERLLVEYLKQHCTNLGIYKMSDETPEKVLQLINSSGNAIVVVGAFMDIGEVDNISAIDPINLFGESEKFPGFFGAF